MILECMGPELQQSAMAEICGLLRFRTFHIIITTMCRAKTRDGLYAILPGHVWFGTCHQHVTSKGNWQWHCEVDWAPLIGNSLPHVGVVQFVRHFDSDHRK